MHILVFIEQWLVEDEKGNEPEANELYAVQEDLHLPELLEFEMEENKKVSEIDAYLKRRLHELYGFVPKRFWWKELKKETQEDG